MRVDCEGVKGDVVSFSAKMILKRCVGTATRFLPITCGI